MTTNRNQLETRVSADPRAVRQAHHDDTSASENVYIHTRVVQQQQVERLDNAMLRRIQAGLRQPDNGEKIMEQEIAVFS